MKELSKSYGVVYNSDNKIEGVKTPENSVYPSKGSHVFECDTREELDSYIVQNGLTEKADEEYTANNNG